MDRSVKSATRVFDLLEVFERQRRPLRVADLVESLDAPQSSVSMLLKTLVTQGYLDCNPDTREYCPSARIANMCDWVTHLPHRPQAIPEAMHKLAEQTGETIMLGRIEGVYLQYTTVIHAPEARRFDVVSGTKRPLHRAALGMVLMSKLDDNRIGLLLRRYNALLPPDAKAANIKATLAEVSVARDQGYYQSGGLTTPGHGVIAMLLPSSLRGQRMALGVGARLDRLQLRKREYIDRLSEAIAHC
jgi:DNA-binding IclR family transcriptional regulator